MAVPRETIKRIIDNVSKYLKLDNVFFFEEVEDKPFTSYFGTLIPITIKGSKGEKYITKKIFVKIGHNNREPDFCSIIREVFEVEIFFYKTLLPIYKQVLKEPLNEIVPESYYLEEQPDLVIVLKDMAESGFSKCKSRIISNTYVLLIIKALVKLHAASIVAKEKDIDFDKHLIRPYSENWPEVLHMAIKQSLLNNIQLFEHTQYKEYLEDLIKQYNHYLNNSITDVKCLVYGHGDLWEENILFKYNNNNPVSACLIDFQKTRTMCPAQDFLQCLLTSVKSSTRKENIDIFINTYINSLHETLNQNAIHLSYTKEDFVHDLKVVAPLCIAMATMSFSLWSGLEHETLVPSKNIASEDNKSVAQNSFKENVTSILDDLNYFGYIDLSTK